MGDGLKGKTLFITGASRGIGRAIALRAARDGANIVVAAKTDRKHPVLAGTIHQTVEAVEAAGGRGLAIRLDIRDEQAVDEAVEAAVRHFGGIDILVNNASAIMLKGTRDLPLKRFDLMFDVNVRGTYVVTRACIPQLLKAANLVMSGGEGKEVVARGLVTVDGQVETRKRCKIRPGQRVEFQGHAIAVVKG